MRVTVSAFTESKYRERWLSSFFNQRWHACCQVIAFTNVVGDIVQLNLSAYRDFSSACSRPCEPQTQDHLCARGSERRGAWCYAIPSLRYPARKHRAGFHRPAPGAAVRCHLPNHKTFAGNPTARLEHRNSVPGLIPGPRTTVGIRMPPS